MADYPISGSASYITCGLEATYGTVSGALAADHMIAFGHDTKITVDRSMNNTPVFGLGSPYASQAYAGVFEGKLTISFILASTYFMELVMGGCTDSGTGPTTHTYVDNTGYVATSFTVANGMNLDTDSIYAYLGCVMDSCEISAKVGEPINVTLNCPYAEETLASTGIDTSPAVDVETPLVFSEGSVVFPSGTTLARVQSFTMRFLKNAQLIAGLGDRCPSKAIWKNMAIEFDMDISYENSSLVQDIYGQSTGPLTATNPAGHANLTLTFTNGGSTAALRSLAITMGTTHIASDSLPQNVGDHMVQTVHGFCLNAPTSIIGSDNTTPSPLVAT